MAKRRFQNRIAVFAIVLAVVPVIAVGMVLVDINRSALRERSEELLFAVADDVSHVMGSALDEGRMRLGAVANILADAASPVQERLALARAFVAAGDGDAVALFDEIGAAIDTIAVPGAAWKPPAVLPAALRERAAADGFAVGEVELVGDAPRVLCAMPVRGREKQWYALSAVSLAPLTDRLQAIARDRFSNRFDAVSVVDSHKRYVVHADPEQLLQPARLEILDGISADGIAAGVLVFRDGTDSESVGVVRSLPDLPWAVIAHVPRDEVYAAVARTRLLIAITVIAAAILALVAAVVWSRRTAKPIRALVEVAHDLGRRKFDRSLALRTGDELETLGDAMTAAARELEASERKLREEATIRTQLGRYLPNKLVDRIVAHDRDIALGGTRREVTIVFADIAAFTALAEKEPPDRVVALLNQLFTILTAIVFRHGGTVDKLIGDCLMAFWGAPDDQPDHAQRAVAAAIDMQRWLDVANDCWETSLGLTIHVAIGVHSGEAIVGNLGSQERMEYTCVGDTVNVAARLESIARPQQILISDATRAALDPAVRCARIGQRQLPGRMAPVELHEVIL